MRRERQSAGVREPREAARYADSSLFVSHREGEARGPELQPVGNACALLLQPVLRACSRRSFCGYLLCLLLKVKVGIEFNSMAAFQTVIHTQNIIIII